MGRQINFFLGPADREPFEKALASAGDLAILRANPATASPETLPSTLFGNDGLRVLLTRKADAASIAFTPVSGRAYFSCDPTVSDVVEYDRCFVSPELIRCGRLYFVAKYFDASGQPATKSAGFLAWADRLLKTTRRSLTMFERGWYAGEDALKLRASGIRFEHL